MRERIKSSLADFEGKRRSSVRKAESCAHTTPMLIFGGTELGAGITEGRCVDLGATFIVYGKPSNVRRSRLCLLLPGFMLQELSRQVYVRLLVVTRLVTRRVDRHFSFERLAALEQLC